MKNTFKKTLAIILAVLMLSASATIAFAAEKKVVIKMRDSFGDGWNGNSIVISRFAEDGFEVVESVTMENHDYKVAELYLSDSDSGYFVFEWVPIDFSDECSFDIIIDGVTVVSVALNNAPDVNKVLYVDCKHDIEGTECRICGYKCGVDFPHAYSSTTGRCACSAECVHHFIGTGLCDICGVECSHDAYEDIQCTPEFVSGTHGAVPEEGAFALLDGNEDTKWCSAFFAQDCPNFVFRYDTRVKLISYTLTTANDTDLYPERNWIDWTVYGSDSKNGEWTVVHEVKDASLPGASFAGSEVFEVNADTAYMYYKVVVNNNGGRGTWGNSQQMAEFTPVIDTDTYYGCSICGQEYKEPAEEETTEPDNSEDVVEICSFCGKEHENLIEEIICLIMEFFHLVMDAFRISL